MTALTSVVTREKVNDVNRLCLLDVNVILPSGLKSVSEVRSISNECGQENRGLSGFLTKAVVHDRDCLVCCEAGY